MIKDIRMTIRPMSVSDLSDCAIILEDAYGQAPYYENFMVGTSQKYLLEKLHSCGAGSFVVLDNDAQTPIGFLMVKLSTWADGSQGMIEEIVVSPNQQKRGIGRFLLHYAHEYLTECGVKSTMLFAKRAPHLSKFYSSFGYTPADDFDVYFRNT